MVLQQHQLLLFLLPLLLFPAAMAQVGSRNKRAVDVGVVLNTGTQFGKMCLTSISMAVEEFYASHSNYTTRLVLHTRDAGGTAIGAAAAALDLLSNVGVVAIIGPPNSGQAVFLSDLCTTSHVPVVSFTATSPSLSAAHTPYFVRTTLNDSAQSAAVASLVHSFQWREAVLVYEDSEFGSGVVPYLIDALQDAGARVPYRCVVRPSASEGEVAEEVRKLMGMETRVFIVHMDVKLAEVVFAKAAEMGMMGEGYAWIMTNAVAMELDSMNRSVVGSGEMEGVLGLRPFVPASKMLDEFTMRWKARFRRENPRIGMGEPKFFEFWAYDTVWAMSLAAERVGATSYSSRRIERGNSSTNLTNLGVSPVGPKLLSSILSTDINGLSGRFRLVEGQLEVEAFELIDMVGNGTATVGYWTPAFGISRSRHFKAEINVPVWPGKQKYAPKGWEWPTKGKKLRIGVPLATGFLEFAKLDFDEQLNKTVGSGFCIDVFEAAMTSLPYKIPYEYISYVDAHGNPNGTYDELVYQVYLKNFDAVVGDTTIWSNRSLYVDFTTPYTESGVVMIMAVKKKPQRLWEFLDPMTHQLWLASGAFFIFTGFVIWLLEHRINDAFRGTPYHQLGTVFYFSFSTMTFSPKENLMSNLARVVIVVWFFFVLVLSSSYTASLSSMLTSQQLQPVVTDVKDLIHRGDNVGYLADSFVSSLLINLGFDENKLIPYNTPEEYAEALSKGSSNGGVTAVFDEIPYVRVFLSRYSSKFTVVGRTYKTDGFGFIFPKGSPLLPDISRAILTVKEGADMMKFEKKLYGDLATARLTSSGGQDGSGATNRLSFRRFLGLFLITGITSTCALFLHIFLFVYQNRSLLDSHDLEGRPLWWKLIKVHDGKDLSSHTFRKQNPTNLIGFQGPSLAPYANNGIAREVIEDRSPDFTTPGSPSGISNSTDCDSDMEEGEGTPSLELPNRTPNPTISSDIIEM